MMKKETKRSMQNRKREKRQKSFKKKLIGVNRIELHRAGIDLKRRQKLN